MSVQKVAALVVDDEPITLSVVASLLTKVGYEVDAVQSSTEAAQRFMAKPSKIIVADYNMQPITGLDLWAMFNRSAAGTVPFVLMTTAPMRKQLEERARALPVMLTKPFNTDLLLRAVHFARGAL